MIYVTTGLSMGYPNRPTYFKQYVEGVRTLESLERFKFVFFCEPDAGPLMEMIPFDLNPIVIENGFPLGVHLHTYCSFYYGFEVAKADFVLYADDDVVLRKDIYRLFEFVYSTESPKDTLLCLMSKQQMLNPTPERLLDVVFKTQDMKFFGGWGFIMGKEFWTMKLKPNWSVNQFFDWTLLERFRGKKQVNIVFPQTSRSWHIGGVGVNFDSASFVSTGFNNSNLIELTESTPLTYRMMAL